MKDLTKGNIYKTFFLFGFPLVVSGLLTMAFNTVDTVIVGKFLGTRALAALGATSPLITFVSSLFWGYNVGFSIYVAKLFGAGEYKKLKSVFYSNVLLSLLLSVLVCGALLVFYRPVFDFLKVEESLRKEAFEYFAVYVGGLFFITSSVTGSYTVNAFGIGSFPLLVSIISAVINFVGNLLSVVVFHWDLIGVAAFSVLSAAVGDAMYYGKIVRCFKDMGVKGEKTEISFRHIKSAFPYALPNTIQQTVMYLASMLVSPIINGMGVAASASYSVVSNVQSVATNAYMNSSRCLSNYAAQCVGEKKYGRINRGVKAGFLQGLAFGLPFIVACTVFAKPICNIFLKADADALTREYSYLCAGKYLPFLVFHLVCNLFHALYKGVKAPLHLIGSTFASSASRIAFSYLFLYLGRGMEGFYTAWVLSWGVEAVFSVTLYFIGLWKPDKKKRERIAQ